MSRVSPVLKQLESPATAPIKGKARAKRGVSKLVRSACDLIVTGEAKTISEAAELLHCSREHLSRMMQKDHVNDYLVLASRRKFSQAVPHATAVKLGLLEAVSEKVRSEVASEVLALANIAPAKQPSVQINNNVNVSAGWILNLTGRPEADVRRELEAEGIVIDDTGAT